MAHYIVSVDDCVFLTSEGEINLAEITAAWREVEVRLVKTGWARVLVNVAAIKTTPPMEEIFDLARLFWRDFPPTGRLALGVRWDQTRFAMSLEMLVRSVGIFFDDLCRRRASRNLGRGRGAARLTVEGINN